MEPCRLTERPFAEFAKLNPGHYLVEAKWDGQRVLVGVADQKVVVTNRYGTEYDFSFLPEYQGEILRACEKLAKPLVLDAEFVSNTPNLYQFLKDRVNAINETQLIVFDILEVDGIDVRAHPLVKRKNMLSHLQGNGKVRPISFELVTSEEAVWDFYFRTVKAKFEGIVVKPVNSIYTDGAWCKLKKTVTHDVVILAVKKTPTFLRDNKDLGQARSFLIGFIDEEGKTVPYGDVSSGYVRVPSDQLRPTGREDDDYVYVVPEMVIEIMAHSLLETRKFREPRIIQVRENKRAVDCKIPDGH